MKNKKRTLLLVAAILVFAIVSIGSYAIYKSSSTGNVTLETANWKIKLNNQDITTNNTFTYNLKDADWTHDTNIDSNEQNLVVIAPGSYGSFNLTIDATEAEVNVKYTITAVVKRNNEVVDLSSVNSNLSIGYYNNDTLVNSNTVTGEMDAMTSHSLELRITWNEVDSTQSNTQDININNQDFIVEVTVITEQKPKTVSAAQTISAVDELVDLGDALRYVGTNPNNYVDFNGETWRIIGVYGDNLKIIKATNPITNQKINQSTCTSWGDCDLSNYLNTTYYNSLSSTAKSMIEEEGNWYIGFANNSDSLPELYTKTKTATWTGKVGLMAGYEYVYAAGESCPNSCSEDCLVNSWLNLNKGEISFTITPVNTSMQVVIYARSNMGCLLSYSVGQYLYSNPVVYLKSNVVITGGTGAIDDHYQLSI